MIPKSELLKDKSRLVDRASACLIGHAIGDSFGDAARSPENQFRFGITTDFSDGPAPGTDDTEFALLTAHTLINANGGDHRRACSRKLDDTRSAAAGIEAGWGK